METTFITIHELTEDAPITYISESIVDILGFTPDEVLNKSSWDFFHPEDLPGAQERYSRTVNLDKASVLAYCRLRNRQGQWVWCECCFSIVYNCMVVCTSIYRNGMSSQKRAVEAPVVRRLFSSSPKDPRYHMLTHLSRRFSQTPKEQSREPRAALFLNRFTRTMTIMHATRGIEKIIGIPPDEIKGKSFYACIQGNCLGDAVRCLESAKGNDSIAYLRFWFSDPRVENQNASDTDDETDTDVGMTDAASEADDGSGGVHLSSPTGSSSNEQSGSGVGVTSGDSSRSPQSGETSGSTSNSRATGFFSASGGVSDRAARSAQFAPPSLPNQTTTSTTTTSSNNSPPASPESSNANDGGPTELEAVVSCTSDGLVVVLRRARPLVPQAVQEPPVAALPVQQRAGMFAAPWATEPVFVPPRQNYQYYPLQPTYAPPAIPAPAYAHAGASAGYGPQPHGPAAEDLWNSIRDVAVFAWALTGINGSLAEYARNPQQAAGESVPPDGVAVWEGAEKSYGGGSGDGR